jgi:hypothetical protein
MRKKQTNETKKVAEGTISRKELAEKEHAEQNKQKEDLLIVIRTILDLNIYPREKVRIMESIFFGLYAQEYAEVFGD